MSWKDIPGWTCKRLEEWYSQLGSQLDEGDTFVEIGVAYGRSLALMEQSSHQLARLIGVDIWSAHQGEGQLCQEEWDRVKLSKTPLQACVAELKRSAPYAFAKVTLRQGTGKEAASDHADGTIKAVFIDEHHTFDSVTDSIQAWLPKVQSGGYLSGHDCNDHYPGVQQAVDKWLPGAEYRWPHPDDNGWGGVWIWRRP